MGNAISQSPGQRPKFLSSLWQWGGILASIGMDGICKYSPLVGQYYRIFTAPHRQKTVGEKIVLEVLIRTLQRYFLSWAQSGEQLVALAQRPLLPNSTVLTIPFIRYMKKRKKKLVRPLGKGQGLCKGRVQRQPSLAIARTRFQGSCTLYHTWIFWAV